ncbi:hypothetical protein HDU89_006698 [Geranomyces variabilis]|nr:hypothetical protein HDU89_006698 [Geranomyces variabilis]
MSKQKDKFKAYVTERVQNGTLDPATPSPAWTAFWTHVNVTSRIRADAGYEPNGKRSTALTWWRPSRAARKGGPLTRRMMFSQTGPSGSAKVDFTLNQPANLSAPPTAPSSPTPARKRAANDSGGAMLDQRAASALAPSSIQQEGGGLTLVRPAICPILPDDEAELQSRYSFGEAYSTLQAERASSPVLAVAQMGRQWLRKRSWTVYQATAISPLGASIVNFPLWSAPIPALNFDRVTGTLSELPVAAVATKVLLSLREAGNVVHLAAGPATTDGAIYIEARQD